MSRNPAPLLAVLVFAACNLPADANSARERLAARDEAAAVLSVPFPVLHFDPVDYLTVDDAKLKALFDTSAQSMSYSTRWGEVDVLNALDAFSQSFVVVAADFGPEFAPLLDIVRLYDMSARLEVENTADHAVTLQGVSLALIDASGAVIQRAVPTNTAAQVIPARSNGTLDIPADAMADLLVGDVAQGRNVELSVLVDHISVEGGGTAKLRTRATALASLAIELGSRSVQLHHVLHTKISGDAAMIKQLNSLTVDSAWIDFEVVNRLPLALEAGITIAPTPADAAGFEPKASPDRIELQTISIKAARALMDGTVTESEVSRITVPLSISTIDLLRTGSISLAGDFTISGNSKRVRIGDSNTVEVKASGKLRVKYKNP